MHTFLLQNEQPPHPPTSPSPTFDLTPSTEVSSREGVWCGRSSKKLGQGPMSVEVFQCLQRKMQQEVKAKAWCRKIKQGLHLKANPTYRPCCRPCTLVIQYQTAFSPFSTLHLFLDQTFFKSLWSFWINILTKSNRNKLSQPEDGMISHWDIL